MGLTSDTLENSSTDQHSAIKSNILNSIDKIRKNKKCADLNAITDYILKTEASNLDQDFTETMISELTNRNKIEIRSTAQKMKFSIKDFFSKCDQIRSFLLIWSHLLKKYLMENFIFVQ